MRSFIFDQSGGSSPKFFTDTDSASFYRSGPISPLRDGCIWLAWTPDNSQRGTFLDVRSKIGTPFKASQTQTYIIGEVAIQFFHWRGFDSSERAINFKSLRRSIWSNKTIQIWPLSGRSVKWPPTQTLTAQTWEAFKARFHG